MPSKPALALLLWLVACGASGEGGDAAQCANGVDDDRDGLNDCEDGGCDDWATCAAGSRVALVINEFVANNAFGDVDEDGEYEDWIELYDPSPEDIALVGLTFTDSPDGPETYTFPDGLVVPAGGYLRLWADQDGGEDHVPFKLAREGGVLVLLDDGVLVDSVAYAEQVNDVAMARIPDGFARWTTTEAPTAGASNTP